MLLDRARAAQAETEALKVSAQETTAALQETTAELRDLKGELKWLQLHTKREQEQALEPKRFRRELIVCAVVAVGATILTIVTVLVLGNILREMAIETFDAARRRERGGPGAGLHGAAARAVQSAALLSWRQKAQARARVRLAIEDTLDEGLPRSFTPEIYQGKVAVLFEHVFETFREATNAGAWVEPSLG